MRTHLSVDAGLLIGLIVLGMGCGGTLKTGTAKKTVNDKPADDGTCPGGQSVCGTGSFSICVDLQNAPTHCGTCNDACPPGIACLAGVCQQTLCTGGSIPISPQVTTRAPDGGADSSVLPLELLADVNGDGRLDLVDHQASPQVDKTTFRVSLGQPTGGFGAPETYRSAFDIRTITATDANNDGVDDLLVLSSANLPSPPTRVEVWLGHPDGHLTLSSATDVSSMGFPLAVGDLSGDGWPDMVTGANYSEDKLSVYLSDSTGALHFSKTYATGYASRIYIKDWDGDGMPDLVILGSGLVILHNEGAGTFAEPVDCGVFFPGEGLVADFDRDGRLDLAIGNEGASIGVSLGLGGCAFTQVTYYDVPGHGMPLMAAADMNGDGLLDLVSISNNYAVDQATGAVITPNDFLFSTLLGNGDGTFRLQGTVTSLGPAVSIFGMLIGEITGDQRPDILITKPDGQVTTLENACR